MQKISVAGILLLRPAPARSSGAARRRAGGRGLEEVLCFAETEKKEKAPGRELNR